jgi:hypothetical protein
MKHRYMPSAIPLPLSLPGCYRTEVSGLPRPSPSISPPGSLQNTEHVRHVHSLASVSLSLDACLSFCHAHRLSSVTHYVYTYSSTKHRYMPSAVPLSLSPHSSVTEQRCQACTLSCLCDSLMPLYLSFCHTHRLSSVAQYVRAVRTLEYETQIYRHASGLLSLSLSPPGCCKTEEVSGVYYSMHNAIRMVRHSRPESNS